VVADEIHQDFVFSGTHTVFSSISPEFEDLAVTCTAPSKTFNLAGLTLSNIFIANAKRRRAFERAYWAAGMSQPNLMGVTACEAAYSGDGDEWLTELLAYLKGNFDEAKQFIASDIPEINVIDPEGTYLLWLDCKELAQKLGLPLTKLDDFMLNRAKLWLDGGTIFGKTGLGFQRVNMATQRGTVLTALTRLRDASRS
jgi:cystathionine beta-lyase